MIVEQILYTATDKDREYGLNGGYCVAAKSNGITDDILEFLEMYHYPLGVTNLDVFKEEKFKSLLEFKDNLIYTTCVNVGYGHDGRDGTLSTLHFVIKKEDFPKINNDTKALDKYYVNHHHSTRHLPIFSIPREGRPTHTIVAMPYREKIMMALANKKKVAILSKHSVPMQSIISGLNVDERIIKWCSHMYDPSRQSEFRFVNGDWSLRHRLNNSWRIFDFTSERL